ncbi:MAG: DoxX family membrane protein [Deltaproteobacteria bacterium]|nr:MAG: DoxX family membrane protein [Deltaproteobacteria bacterium]
MAIFTFLKKFVSNKYTSVGLRMILGAVFIWSSIDKISDPEGFIKVVESYNILPFTLSVVFAVALPWVELISGLLLIAGVYTRSSAVVLTSMLIVFLVAISINLYRGADLACGCFDVQSESGDLWLTFVRDILLIVMGLQIFFFDRGSFSLSTLFTKNSRKIPDSNP